jgi:DnaJ domain
MLYRHGQQGRLRTVFRGTQLVLAVYSAVGLSVVLLTMFFFLQELEAAAFATIVLFPATGLLWVVRMGQRERRQWEQWRQKRRIHGEERTQGNRRTANDPVSRPWWEVLEISERSTFEDVKAAYRTKIKECHPDKVIGLAREFQELADRKTKELNLAFKQARIARTKLPPEQHT